MSLPSHVAGAFAAAPGRVLAIPELRRLGHHRLEVADWARDGFARRLHHGVYRDAAGQVPDDQRLHAAAKYLELRRRPGTPPAVLTGCGTLGIRGVPEFCSACTPLALIDRSRRPRGKPGVLDVRRTDLTAVRAVELRGSLLACPARALADVALDTEVGDGPLRRGVDDLCNRRMMTVHEAVAVWQALGHAGAQRLLAMYSAGVFDHESDGERDAFRLLFAGRHPEPDCQVVLVGRLRADFAYLAAALIVEYHGGIHDRRVDEDATRSHVLEAAGHRTVVVTKSMLRDAHNVWTHIDGLRRQREHQVAIGTLSRPHVPPQPPRRVPLRTLLPAG